MYKRLLIIFTALIMTCPVFAEQGFIAADINQETLTANCSGDPLYFEGTERTSGALVYAAQWIPNEYTIKYYCDDDQNEVLEQTVKYETDYQLLGGDACSERPGHSFARWECNNEIADSDVYNVVGDSECRAVWDGCGDGEYSDGVACTACPEGYEHSDGDRGDITSCYKEETNTGNQIPDDIVPEYCANVTLGTCTPNTCTYRDHYDTEDTPCVPEDCVQPIIAVTASVNAYVNNDGVSCSLCSDYGNGDYKFSEGGNISFAKCYKEIQQTCVQNACTNPDIVGCQEAICADSCSCGELENYKEYVNGTTEGTTSQSCTRAVAALVHKQGYYTATNLRTCPPCDRGYTSDIGMERGIGVCEMECSAPCNGNDEGACPAHASCTYDTDYINVGKQYGDTASCDAQEILCPVKNVTCYPGYTYNETTNTCEANCNTVTLNMNGGEGEITVLYKYTNDTKWYTTKISDTQCSGVVSDLAIIPNKQGFSYAGHYNSTVGTTNRISSTGVLDANWIITDNQTVYAQWGPINCECTTGEGAVNCVGDVNDNNACDYVWGCENGYYHATQSATDADVDFTATCNACPDGYVNSDTNATSDTQCYKPCESTCIAGGCPDPDIANCSYDITTTNGTQYYGGACSAAQRVCAIDNMECKVGYYKATYVGENAEHRYSKGRSHNSDICWYDGISTNCFGNTVVDLLAYEWMVPFEYGDVYGKSVCSKTPGSSYSIGNPDETGGGKNCWCKLSSYELYGQRHNAAYTSWVNISDASWSVSSCTNYCSDACANRTQKSAAFRSMLFKGTDLYETCELEEYSIEYELNNGEIPVVARKPESYTIISGTITLPVPTRPGFEFVGWCDDEDLTMGCAITRTIPQGSMGNRVFYAKWNFVCESNRWLHVGEERICLYTKQYTHPAMALKLDGKTYYLNLSTDTDLPLRANSNKKLHMEYDGRTYNIYDYSAQQ